MYKTTTTKLPRFLLSCTSSNRADNRTKHKSVNSRSGGSVFWTTSVRIWTDFGAVSLRLSAPPHVRVFLLTLSFIVFSSPQCLNRRELRCIIIQISLADRKLLRSHHLSPLCLCVSAPLTSFASNLFCYVVILSSWLIFSSLLHSWVSFVLVKWSQNAHYTLHLTVTVSCWHSPLCLCGRKNRILFVSHL